MPLQHANRLSFRWFPRSKACFCCVSMHFSLPGVPVTSANRLPGWDLPSSFCSWPPEGSTNYVARSKQLPLAEGAIRGDLGGGVSEGGLHRLCNASGNIGVSLTPWSSYLAAYHGKAELGGKQEKEDGRYLYRKPIRQGNLNFLSRVVYRQVTQKLV